MLERLALVYWALRHDDSFYSRLLSSLEIQLWMFILITVQELSVLILPTANEVSFITQLFLVRVDLQRLLSHHRFSRPQ